MLPRHALTLLLLLALHAPNSSAQEAWPAAEIVVVVSEEDLLVGLGEPPQSHRVPVLIYVLDDGSLDMLSRATDLRAGIGGAPAARLYNLAGEDFTVASKLIASLKAKGFQVVEEVLGGDGPNPGDQLTIDTAGYHKRSAPGQPAKDVPQALTDFGNLTSYGFGHGEPLFEPDAGGAMRQLRVEGWDRPAAAYACPFPANPSLAGPAGTILELSLADNRSAPEEALAAWCDHAAESLARSCGADGLAEALETGTVEVRFGDPPGLGLWWLRPHQVELPVGIGTGDACVEEALLTLSVAALHAGLTLRYRLVEGALDSGCGRVVEEKCAH